MRQFIYLSVVVLSSCTPKTLQDNQVTADTIIADSTATSSSLMSDPVADTEYSVDEYADSDTMELAIQMAIEQLDIESEQKITYTLSASYNGYESGADAAYYFDSLFNLIYCTTTWSMEGTSGEGTYYFDMEKLIGSKELNSDGMGDEEILYVSAFDPTCGYAKTFDENGQPVVRYMTAADFSSKERDVKNDYDRLIGTVVTYSDSVTIGGETVTIHVENTVNYGEDYTETEHYEISKTLFDELIK